MQKNAGTEARTRFVQMSRADMEAALIAADELAKAYVALCEMTKRDFHTHDCSRYAAYRAAIGAE